MAGMKYLGPGDSLVIEDRVYYPGDDVPISKEQAERLAVSQHARFEGMDLAAEGGVRYSPPPVAPRLAPRGDRGEPLDLKSTKEAAEAVETGAVVAESTAPPPGLPVSVTPPVAVDAGGKRGKTD